MPDLRGALANLRPRPALELAALADPQVPRAKVAPTRELTVDVLWRLSRAEPIEVPWPEPAWDAAPAACITSFEGLQWQRKAGPIPLLTILDQAMGVVRSGQDDGSSRLLWLAVWKELALAEAESYLAYQLGRHHFDAVLSVAQWRYCSWVATRQGASFAAQQQAPETREFGRSSIRTCKGEPMRWRKPAGRMRPMCRVRSCPRAHCRESLSQI